MAAARPSRSFSFEDAQGWEYRGEGAANVVVAYVGSDEDLMGKVLRIQKVGSKKEKHPDPQVPAQSLPGSTKSCSSDRAASDDAKDCDHETSAANTNLGSHTEKSAPSQHQDELTARCQESETSHTNAGDNGAAIHASERILGPALVEEQVRTGPVLDPLEQEIWAKFPTVSAAKTPVELVYEYTTHVMGPLLGEAYVDPGLPVRADRDFLTALTAAVEKCRPPRWRREGPLLLRSGWALLIRDHAYSSGGSLKPTKGQEKGPSWRREQAVCVEIKPKAGFLPTSECIAHENRVKLEKTRYELMQHWKAKEGKVDAISSYNPLHLFSSDPARVRRAIDSLFDHPQNNLRVFLNGETISWTPRDSPGEIGTQTELEKALEGFCDSASGSRVEVLKELLVHRLAGSVVLQRLRSAQMLDQHDIEGVIHLYWALGGVPPQQGALEALPDATKRLLSLSRKSQLEILRDFLIASTAKDCGLMITFEAVGEEAAGQLQVAEAIQKLRGRNYLCKVAYVDLDLKPLKKLPRYWELDQQIAAAYKASSN